MSTLFFFIVTSYLVFIISFGMFVRFVFKELDFINARDEERATRIVNTIYHTKQSLTSLIEIVTTPQVKQKKTRIKQRTVAHRQNTSSRKKVFKTIKGQLKELS